MRDAITGGSVARLRAVLAILLGTLIVSSPLKAQVPDAARLSAAREMMEVAGVAKQFDELMPLLAQQLSQSFVAVAPEKADEIRQVFAQLPAKFIDRKAELIDEVASLYAQELSVEELGAVSAFYKSPAGARLLAVTRAWLDTRVTPAGSGLPITTSKVMITRLPAGSVPTLA